MPEPTHPAAGRRMHYSLWDPFEIGYRVPPKAPVAYRFWSAAVAGFLYLGWWYGMAQPYALLPDRPLEKGTR
ncbi:hypothetical protein ACFUIW_15840 [Streptomyces sp. NPDC057245]|uniref:hypothetical protein n=1 Tax=Streptomyces TaxID=1883 RepID=UPI001C1E3465|nr:hypothetical protein [Streptomyces sp. A108]MBU6532297.1 hypothetical protein [Streptomyces sp. A108]